MKKNLYKLLAANPYPGRGIVMGLAPDGRTGLIAYWIMGRSANSRNRVFETFPGGIETVAADPAKLEDAHLIIYSPVRTAGRTAIVTNGDQTDTIYDYVMADLYPGYAFEAALATRTFEDDAPNFTPRISGVMDMATASHKLAIIKTEDGNAAVPLRQTFDYPVAVPGEGHFISTYKKDGKVLPSFSGEPVRVGIDTDDPAEFASRVWEALDADNKVSLFVRSIDLGIGRHDDIVVNKYGKAGE